MSADAAPSRDGADAPQPGDVAPGDQRAEGNARGAVLGYALGLGLASVLTVAAFVLPRTGLVYPAAMPVALVVIAIAQMGVHLAFFLHITTGPDNTNNILALAFGVLIVFLVMAGSLWIMANLNQNMPGMDAIMKMQR